MIINIVKWEKQRSKSYDRIETDNISKMKKIIVDRWITFNTKIEMAENR